MADHAATRALLQRLRFTIAASTTIVNDQGIDSLAELEILSDEDAEGLCKVVRRPGGSVPNPNAGGIGQPPTIPAAGENVSMMAEANLKLCGYFLRHQKRIGRTADYVAVTLDAVRQMKDLKESEKDHVDPTVVPDIDLKDMTTTLESVEEYIRGHLGVKKVPLSYGIRKDATVTPEADDPSTNYTILAEEMIARAPIEGATADSWCDTFAQDNIKIWNLLSTIFRGTEIWTYLKPFQRARDGRGAYLNAWDHYLGPDHVDNMASRAERTLETTSYAGEKRRWNFEKFVSMHKKQHTVLENLTEQGYSGIDDRSKVRHLLAGIKTKELDAVKSQILSSAELRSDFDGCVSLYKTFIEQAAPNNPTFNISDTRTEKVGGSNKWNRSNQGKKHNNKRGRDDDDEDMEVEDRYYNSREYKKLKPPQREALRKLREKREAAGSGKPRGDSKKFAALSSKVADMDRNISLLVKAASKVTFDDPEDGESDSDEENKKQKSNRGNQALTRKKR
jgi:hypothetical protein